MNEFYLHRYVHYDRKNECYLEDDIEADFYRSYKDDKLVYGVEIDDIGCECELPEIVSYWLEKNCITLYKLTNDPGYVTSDYEGCYYYCDIEDLTNKTWYNLNEYRKELYNDLMSAGRNDREEEYNEIENELYEMFDVMCETRDASFEDWISAK